MGILWLKNEQIEVFHFLSPKQEEELIEIGRQLLSLVKIKNSGILNELIQLFRVRNGKGVRKPKRPPADYNKFRFHTPEVCPNPDNRLSLQSEKCNKISELQQRDSMDLQTSEKDLKGFNSSIGPTQYWLLNKISRWKISWSTFMRFLRSITLRLVIYEIESQISNCAWLISKCSKSANINTFEGRNFGWISTNWLLWPSYFFLPNSEFSCPIFAEKKLSDKGTFCWFETAER